MVSLGLVVHISKSASDILKPRILLLVTALLEALSGLELKAMNYLSLHLGRTLNTQEKVSLCLRNGLETRMDRSNVLLNKSI